MGKVIEAADRFRSEPEPDYTDIDTFVVAQKLIDQMMENPVNQLDKITIRTDSDE